MNTYKFQAWLIGINLVLFVTIFLGFLFSFILAFCQIVVNFIHIIEKRRIRQRLYYFAGVITYFSFFIICENFNINIPEQLFIFLGFVPPIFLAFYSLYLAKLDKKEEDDSINVIEE